MAELEPLEVFVTINSLPYLFQLHKLLEQSFNLEEIRGICFRLQIDHENIPGNIKSAFIRNLLLSLGKHGRLPEFIELLCQERPGIVWSPVPDNFEMPDSFGLDDLKVWDGRNPYLGLTAFRENDAQFFFGRESLVDDLLQRVRHARFIVIAGPSGSGKSSVARAGLFHALKENRLDRSNSWLLGAMQPKGNPIEQLADVVARWAKLPDAGNFIRQEGTSNPAAFHRQAETFLTDDPDQRCVLLVDQFEEVFTQTKDEATRQAFINLLTEAAQTPNGRTIIVLSLRSDFVSNCASYPALRALMSEQFQLVGSMSTEDLTKAITLPALEVGAEIDPELVSKIIADMKGEPGALPLMSFALRDLFEAEKTTKGKPMSLTLPEYLHRGGIESALERHANKVFNDFSEEQKTLAQNIFSKLIEVGQGRVDTRRTATFAELVPTNINPQEVVDVIASLTEEGVRLITTSGVESSQEIDENTYMQTTVTLAHEKLIDAWPWLRRLVDENRELIALQNQITNDAKLWETQQDAGFLYRGGRLSQVEEKLSLLQPKLDGHTQQFIKASLQTKEEEQQAEEDKIRQQEALKQERRSSGRFRRLTRLLGIIAFLAGIATVFALNQFTVANQERGEAQAESTRAYVAEITAVAAQATSDLNARSANLARATAEVGATAESQARNDAVIAEAEAIQAQREAELAQQEAELARQETNALRLAVASQNQLNVNYELALLLAIEAAKQMQSLTDAEVLPLEIDQALRRTLLYQGQPIARLTAHNEKIKEIFWSPSNDYFLTADSKVINVWDADTLQLVNTITPPRDILKTAWRSDGQYIAIAIKGEEQTVEIWPIIGSEAAIRLDISTMVNQLAWSHTGNLLATGGQDGHLTIWEIDQQSVNVTMTFTHTKSVEFVSWNHADSQIATISDGKTYLWDLEPDEEIANRSFENDGRPVESVSWNRDDAYILTVDNKAGGNTAENNIYIWNTQTLSKEKTLSHLEAINDAIWSHSGEYIATAQQDGLILIWNVESAETKATLDGHTDSVHDIQWSLDDRQILSASEDGTIMIWDANTGGQLARLTGHDDGVIQAIWNQDETQVISISADKTVHVWNPSPGTEVATLIGHMAEITYIDWNTDGTKLVTASADGTAIIWDAQTGKRLYHLNDPASEPMNQALWSPDGKFIVTIGNEGFIRIWDALDGSLLNVYKGHEVFINQAAWYEDGIKLLLVTASNDGTAKIWSLAGSDINLERVLEVDKEVNQALWNPDGTKIATVAFSTSSGIPIQIWDSVTGEPLLSLEGYSANIRYADWNSDGTKFVSASDDFISVVWNVTMGNRIAVLTGHEGNVNQATWSPDSSSRILTASDDGTAIIWDAVTGNQIRVFNNHQKAVNQANWSPNGEYIVTASNDTTSQIWDVNREVQVASLEGHTGFVTQAVWNPAGTRIATISNDNTARIYYVLSEDLIEVACQRSVRNMSEAEWSAQMEGSVYHDTCPGKSSPN